MKILMEVVLVPVDYEGRSTELLTSTAFNFKEEMLMTLISTAYLLYLYGYALLATLVLLYLLWQMFKQTDVYAELCC